MWIGKVNGVFLLGLPALLSWYAVGAFQEDGFSLRFVVACMRIPISALIPLSILSENFREGFFAILGRRWGSRLVIFYVLMTAVLSIFVKC